MEFGQMQVMGDALQKEAKIKKLENEFLQYRLINRVRWVLIALSLVLLWGSLSSWSFLISRHWANLMPYICAATLGFSWSLVSICSITIFRFLTFKVVRYPLIEGPSSVEWFVIWTRIGSSLFGSSKNPRYWQVEAVLSLDDLKNMNPKVKDIINHRGGHGSKYNMPYFETIIHGMENIPTVSFYCHFRRNQYVDLILSGVFDDPAAMESKVEEVTAVLKSKLKEAVENNVDWRELMTKNPEYFDTPCVRITRATFPGYEFSTGEN